MSVATRLFAGTVATAACLTLGACVDPPTALEPPADVLLAKPGACPGHPSCTDDGDGAGSSATPLQVTLRDAPSDGIVSDGYGSYVDGADGVEAIVMDNGNLSFDLGGSDRCVQLLFDGPDDSSWPGTCEQTRTSSGDPDVEGGFHGLAVGESMTTRSQVYWAADERNWFLRFGATCADGAGDPVPENRVTVTRTAEDTWTYATNDKDGVTPNAYLCYSNMKGRPGLHFVAELHVPYGLTLVAQ